MPEAVSLAERQAQAEAANLENYFPFLAILNSGVALSFKALCVHFLGDTEF